MKVIDKMFGLNSYRVIIDLNVLSVCLFSPDTGTLITFWLLSLCRRFRQMWRISVGRRFHPGVFGRRIVVVRGSGLLPPWDSYWPQFVLMSLVLGQDWGPVCFPIVTALYLSVNVGNVYFKFVPHLSLSSCRTWPGSVRESPGNVSFIVSCCYHRLRVLRDVDLRLLSLAEALVPVPQGHGVLGSGNGFWVWLRSWRRRRSLFLPDWLWL